LGKYHIEKREKKDLIQKSIPRGTLLLRRQSRVTKDFRKKGAMKMQAELDSKILRRLEHIV